MHTSPRESIDKKLWRERQMFEQQGEMAEGRTRGTPCNWLRTRGNERVQGRTLPRGRGEELRPKTGGEPEKKEKGDYAGKRKRKNPGNKRLGSLGEAGQPPGNLPDLKESHNWGVAVEEDRAVRKTGPGAIGKKSTGGNTGLTADPRKKEKRRRGVNSKAGA